MRSRAIVAGGRGPQRGHGAVGCAVLAIAAGLAAAGSGCEAPRPTAPPAAPADAATPPRATRAAVVDWPPVVMRCLQWGDTCGGPAATCRALGSLSEPMRDEVSRCFDASACDAAGACLAAFVASHPLSRIDASPAAATSATVQ